MLAKSHRFHGYGSLRYAYQRGGQVKDQYLSVRSIENSRRNTYRCAVVVSRKVNKSAVARNKIRRKIYEIVRLNSQNITRPFDIVISVYDGSIVQLSPIELEKRIIDLFVKAKIV